MPRVVVIHRDVAEASQLAARLRELQIDAEPYPGLGPKGFRELRANPPQAIVIDLMRAPSYGRTMGALLRESKSLRAIPLVFLAGDPAKTAATRQVLPDAVYTPWSKVSAAIERAISRAPAEPSLPIPPDRSLAQKLGIGPESVVCLCQRPADCELALPAGARVSARTNDADIVLLWAKSEAALARELPALAKWMSKGRRLWLLWPKKASGVATNLTMPRVRELATAYGLIDYKVCSVSDTWSAMAVGARRYLSGDPSRSSSVARRTT